MNNNLNKFFGQSKMARTRTGNGTTILEELEKAKEKIKEKDKKIKQLEKELAEAILLK